MPPAPLQSIASRFSAISRAHDVATLDAYVASDLFFDVFRTLPPKQRVSVFAAYATARRSCLTRLKIIRAGKAKADWKKPGEVERFKRSWAKHGGNSLLVANEMGITVGAAIRAYSRFVVNGATATTIPGPGTAQERSRIDGRHSARRDSNAAATPVSAAA
jgi:hypothetical protein